MKRPETTMHVTEEGLIVLTVDWGDYQQLTFWWFTEEEAEDDE